MVHGAEDDRGKWYYCLDHKAVEDIKGCRSSNRLGPYPTREEAENALQKVAERNAKWDEEDRLWNEAAPGNKKRL